MREAFGHHACHRFRCRSDFRKSRARREAGLLVAPQVERPPDRTTSPLHNAAFNTHIKEAEALLLRGEPVNCLTLDGETPLHVAANTGNTQLVQLLCDHCADLDASDQHGDTPLAKGCAHLGVTDLLISRGASVNIPNNWGDRTIHTAAFRGQPGVLRSLARAGASVNSSGKVAPLMQEGVLCTCTCCLRVWPVPAACAWLRLPLTLACAVCSLLHAPAACCLLPAACYLLPVSPFASAFVLRLSLGLHLLHPCKHLLHLCLPPVPVPKPKPVACSLPSPPPTKIPHTLPVSITIAAPIFTHKYVVPMVAGIGDTAHNRSSAWPPRCRALPAAVRR